MRKALAVTCVGLLATGCKTAAPSLGNTKAVAVDGSMRPKVARVAVSSTEISDSPERDVLGYPLVTADKVELRRLLAERDFDALEAALDRWEKAFERDPSFELALLDGFDAFEDPDPRMRPQLDAWSAARPGSHLAHLGIAFHENAIAWNSRGLKLAKETSAAQFRAMRDAVDRAGAEVTKAFALHRDCVVGYFALTGGALAAGGLEDRLDLRHAGLAAHPDSRRLRTRYMASLSPRWGGSYELMEEFASEVDKDAQRVPGLRLVRGFISSDRAFGAWLNGDHAEAVRQYTVALQSGPEAGMFRERGEVLNILGQDSESFLDFEAAVRVAPQDAQCVGKYAHALARQGRSAEAHAQIDLLRAIRGPSEERTKAITAVVTTLVFSGWDLAKKQGKVAEGIAVLDHAVAVDPKNAETLYWRGHAFLLKNEDSRALSDFEEASRIDPDHFEAFRGIDEVHARRGEWGEIVTMWDTFLAKHPNHPGALRERAGTKNRKGDVEGARADMKRACDLGDAMACGYVSKI